MPSNDNQERPRRNTRWIYNLFACLIVAAIPGGFFLAWWLWKSWPLMISGIAFIILMAGS
jgi:hypothetical protein